MLPDNQQNLFFVRRNTNRNEVHYAIKFTREPCAPAGSHPIVVYWQMHEKGPGITEPVTVFELPAFGIHSQQKKGNSVDMTLTALPERIIRIDCTDQAQCRYTPYMNIAGAEAELVSFYVHAEPGFLLPKVKYIEIKGLRDGVEVTERIMK